MTGLKKIVFALVALFTVPALVSADEPNVSDASELAGCLATSGNVCVLGGDVNLTSTVNIENGVKVTLDLNNHNITADLDTMFFITEGSLDVTGTGTITNSGDVFYVHGNTAIPVVAREAVLEIGSDVSVVSNSSNCIYIRGKGSKAVVNGSLESKGTYAAIQGNGLVESTFDNGNTEIIINEGAVIKSADQGIYHPQSGTLTVNGGTITGTTGIEMRSGDLIINGGTITSTATDTTVTPNGNGSSVVGAAVAVAQHTTLQSASITVNGGVLSGPTALLESTPQHPSDEEVIVLNVTGGKFIATTDDGQAVYSENKTEFITGGEFSENLLSDDVTSTYLKQGLDLAVDEDGNFVVGKKYVITVESAENGTVVSDKESAFADDVITLTLTAKEGYKLDSVKVLDKATNTYVTVDASTGKFTMPSSDVVVTATFAKVEPNPNTGDGIVTYLLFGMISLVGFAGLYVSKKKAFN